MTQKVLQKVLFVPYSAITLTDAIAMLSEERTEGHFDSGLEAVVVLKE